MAVVGLTLLDWILVCWISTIVAALVATARLVRANRELSAELVELGHELASRENTTRLLSAENTRLRRAWSLTERDIT